MLKWIKQLFCFHDYYILKWHFTHGQYGNDPRYIEGFETCIRCGKKHYFTVKRGSKMEQYIVGNMKDKQW